jgi:hypothetical protein
MEAKKRGRGRPRKSETIVSKPKGKRGRPKKQKTIEVYDISTGLSQVSEEVIEKHLEPSPNFIFTITDGNEERRAILEISGNSTLGMKKIQEYYLNNKNFREFINDIINGAVQVKALRVAEELESIVL